jgi:hypothetical protein
LLANPGNQISNIINPPNRDAAGQFYAFGVSSFFNALPPGGFANREERRDTALEIANDLRQAKESGFR